MGKVACALVSALSFAVGCDDFAPSEPLCADRASEVPVDESIEALDGESARERFERAAKPWDCTVTWLTLPAQIGSAEPPAGSSVLDVSLERTSDVARYREYAQTREEKYDSRGCQKPAVLVPCSLGLRSEDGALDETLACELRLQGQNTLIHLELAEYEFTGTHTTTFVDDIPRDAVELNLTYVPGIDPTSIDGAIVEYGTRSGPGVDPFATTAVIACTPL